MGWFMDSDSGALCGNGKYNDDRAGRIEPGQVLTMQVNTDTGTPKFWLDGKPHGMPPTMHHLASATTPLYREQSLDTPRSAQRSVGPASPPLDPVCLKHSPITNRDMATLPSPDPHLHPCLPWPH